MTHQQAFTQLLREIGYGRMSSTAYDTAWVARMVPYDKELGRRALAWLRAHQLPDGTWGAASPAYYHDRLVCTLAALVALAENNDPQDQARIQQAKSALQTVVRPLADGALAETIAAETILPTLLDEAEALGLVQRWDDHELQRLSRLRKLKIDKIPQGIINRNLTLNFSSEMTGKDAQHLLDIDNLQEANGSIGNSPSATAFYASQVRPGDPAALAYLRHNMNADGGIPNVAPFDMFEVGWTLYNLHLCGLADAHADSTAPHVAFLAENWDTTVGAAFASNYAAHDGDLTSLVYQVLRLYGQKADVQTVLNYAELDYYRCYALEVNPSVSTNIHVLGALRQAGIPARDAAVQKIVRFLHGMAFWFDKWHVSPYYTTGHAILAGVGYVDHILEDAIVWMLDSQNADGSWGYFMPTAEETAYCLQALVAWKNKGYPLPDAVLKRGAAWLAENMTQPYPPLWVGKCLYTPVNVVRSAIYSALLMAEKALAQSAYVPERATT